jgi:hypothetical protein
MEPLMMVLGLTPLAAAAVRSSVALLAFLMCVNSYHVVAFSSSSFFQASPALAATTLPAR